MMNWMFPTLCEKGHAFTYAESHVNVNLWGLHAQLYFCQSVQRVSDRLIQRRTSWQQQKAPEAVSLCPIGEASLVVTLQKDETPLDGEPRENVLMWDLGMILVMAKSERGGSRAFQKMGLGQEPGIVGSLSLLNICRGS